MTIQRHFKLALTAGHTIPLVINANQYDSGEQWLFTLYNDGVRYTPSSGAIVGIKADRLGIINTGTVDANGRVVINETRQMTAAVGKNIFELLIDDQTHGTANFMVLVEPRPGDNADMSESDYSLFEEAIQGTSQAAIKAGVQEWMDENLTDPTDPIVDASLSLSGAAADAKKTGDEISDLKSAIDANEVYDGDVIYFNDSWSDNGSSNWPSRSVRRNTSLWNGTFGTGGENYYSCLNQPSQFSASESGITSNFPLFTSLVMGRTYEINSFIVSGSMSVGSGKVAEVVLRGLLKFSIGERKTFTYNGNETRFYLHFSSGVVMSNVVIAVIIKDVTKEIPTGATRIRLSGYKWAQGRHITRGNSLASPSSATNTISMTSAIPYDFNTYFVLKEGWKCAFVSAQNNSVTGIAGSFISTAGKIDMLDVYNNMAKAAQNVTGDSLAIMIRNSEESAMTVSDVDVDDAIEMYVINPKGDATKPKTWVAIGDSITDGRYTVLDGSTVRAKTNHFSQYGYVASKLLGIDNFIEYGYGGMGYIHVANDGTYLTDVLAMDLGSPDIITVCLGVNDRSQTLGDENSEASDGTISGSIRNCCEVLGTNYPNAQIVFMTPLNGWATGSASTGWCKRSGPTHLADIADMVKYWANHYGFKVIDMLNSSPVNDFNIQSLILDELHPTMEAHYMIGHYLAGELPYRCR